MIRHQQRKREETKKLLLEKFRISLIGFIKILWCIGKDVCIGKDAADNDTLQVSSQYQINNGKF